IRRVQTRIDPADRLGQSAGLQGIDTGNVWKERRERYDELLLRNAVQPQSRQGQVLAEAIVKQAEAGAQHSLGLARLAAAQSPGDTDARREVLVIADIVLCLVAESQAERKVRPHAPVVLREEAQVVLIDVGNRRSAGDGELAGSGAHLLNLGHRKTLLLKQKS